MNIETAPCFSNVAAVIVTFHPDIEIKNRVEIIRKQVKELIIIDNNSSKECQKKLDKITVDLDIFLLKNPKNLGIAKALNQAFDFIKFNNPEIKWILTLDQDTICHDNLVNNLIQAYEDCSYRERVGVIGSNYQEKTTKKILHEKVPGSTTWEEVKNLPTSGCLNSVTAYTQVGKFREEFFIDYVDTDYCMRLRSIGYCVLISPIIGMVHPLGYYRASKLHRMLTGNLMVTNYPPIRHYYWSRNGTVLIKENCFRDIRWALRQSYYLFIRRLLIIIAFEEQKIKKLSLIAIGIMHGLKGKLGKNTKIN